MKNELNISGLKTKFRTNFKKNSKHLSFVVLLLVLLCYVFAVWRISQLATAEPADNGASAQTVIPKINKTAVNQVLQLEQTNSQIHSLFNQARNNPFSE